MKKPAVETPTVPVPYTDDEKREVEIANKHKRKHVVTGSISVDGQSSKRTKLESVPSGSSVMQSLLTATPTQIATPTHVVATGVQPVLPGLSGSGSLAARCYDRAVTDAFLAKYGDDARVKMFHKFKSIVAQLIKERDGMRFVISDRLCRCSVLT